VTVANTTVLLVDDDPMVRAAMTAMLAHLGMSVVQAEDGASGLAAIRKSQPDIVLLDLSMPGMPGIDALPVIVNEFPSLPIVVVSGQSLMEDAIEALRRGAWDYIIKPVFNTEILSHVIVRALEKASLRKKNDEYRRDLELTNTQLSEALRELRDDQSAGRALQFQLLPPDEIQIGPCHFSRRLHPSRLLSGDFVDYFALGPRHAGFFLADVAGHGAASALITGIVSTLVGKYRSALGRGDDTILHPDRLLTLLDRDVDALGMDRHVTLIYGVFDFEQPRLVLGNAAMFPYPILSDSQGTRFFDCPGRALGLFGDGRHGCWDVPLHSSGSLVLATDGIYERIEGTFETKQMTFLALGETCPDLDAMEQKLGLTGDVTLRDDIALLQIRWGGRHA